MIDWCIVAGIIQSIIGVLFLVAGLFWKPLYAWLTPFLEYMRFISSSPIHPPFIEWYYPFCERRIFMFQELLLLITLILALYGLAHVMTFLALWLTAPMKGKPYRVLIDLKPDENYRSAVINVRERLAVGGLLNHCQIYAVDRGLSPQSAKQAEEYCKGEQIRFCNEKDLSANLEITPFQNEENTV